MQNLYHILVLFLFWLLYLFFELLVLYTSNYKKSLQYWLTKVVRKIMLFISLLVLLNILVTKTFFFKLKQFLNNLFFFAI